MPVERWSEPISPPAESPPPRRPNCRSAVRAAIPGSLNMTGRRRPRTDPNSSTGARRPHGTADTSRARARPRPLGPGLIGWVRNHSAAASNHRSEPRHSGTSQSRTLRLCICARSRSGGCDSTIRVTHQPRQDEGGRPRGPWRTSRLRWCDGLVLTRSPPSRRTPTTPHSPPRWLATSGRRDGRDRRRRHRRPRHGRRAAAAPAQPGAALGGPGRDRRSGVRGCDQGGLQPQRVARRIPPGMCLYLSQEVLGWPHIAPMRRPTTTCAKPKACSATWRTGRRSAGAMLSPQAPTAMPGVRW